MTVIRTLPEHLMDRYVSVHVASQMLGFCPRRVTQMCSEGVFSTAHKPGCGRNAHWRILRAEILKHQMNGHALLLRSNG